MRETRWSFRLGTAPNLIADGTYTIVNQLSGMAIDDPAFSTLNNCSRQGLRHDPQIQYAQQLAQHESRIIETQILLISDEAEL
jgi:hypothetical protein